MTISSRRGASSGWGALRREPERGASVVEFAIITPVVLGILFGIFQLGLWLHARDVASSAAQVGLQAATTTDASPSAGQVAAGEHLDQVGGDQLQGAMVSSSSDGESVTVTVTGHAESVLPGLPLPSIRATATGTTERLTQ